MYKINSVKMPSPSSLKVGIMDITDAGRNAKGMMIIELIARKRKLDISYSILSQEELSLILKAISGIFFKVEFLDPLENKRLIKTFYVGDRNQDIAYVKLNKTTYKDIKFNLIER